MNNSNINNNTRSNTYAVRAVSEFRENSEAGHSIVPLDLIVSAYMRCVVDKGNTPGALDFGISWREGCRKLLKEINERTYHISTSICFIVNFPVKREVFAASFRDRVVQWFVINELMSCFEDYFHSCMMSNRKGKGTSAAILKVAEDILIITDNYTKDAWIYKYDLQGFFMSIDKEILNKKLIKFIKSRYKGVYLDTILWLVDMIVMHCPQYNCIRKSKMCEWDGLSHNKSLFYQDKNHGVPIGNLTSQIFAMFLLVEAVKFVEDNTTSLTTEFVDDFISLFKSEKEILSFIPHFRRFLKEELHITLHLRKSYIQHSSKGVNFVGATIKPHRIYISNRTVNRCEAKANWFCRQNKDFKNKNAELFVSVINSYFGLMRHYSSYKIRERISEAILSKWGDVLYFSNNYEKAIIKQQYKKRQILTKTLKLSL